jgi:hypothetical protein
MFEFRLTRSGDCVPDAVQRPLGAAKHRPVTLLRSAGTQTPCTTYGPGSAAHHAAKGGALRCVQGTMWVR